MCPFQATLSNICISKSYIFNNNVLQPLSRATVRQSWRNTSSQLSQRSEASGWAGGRLPARGRHGSVALVWRESCGGGGREARESAGSGWCWVPRRTTRALLANLGHDPAQHGARSARAGSPCLQLPPRTQLCRPFAFPRHPFSGVPSFLPTNYCTSQLVTI